MTHDGEAVIDFFRPVKHDITEGVLVLTNRRLIFAVEKGIVRRSFCAVLSVNLDDLKDIKRITGEEIKGRTVVYAEGSSIFMETGRLFISSSAVVPFVQFYNERIFAMVQQLKGLVKRGNEWIKPEEEMRKHVALYINENLVQDPRKDLARERARALVRKVRGTNASCCVCGGTDTVAWIVDVALFRKTSRTFPLERMLIFLRLLCREHEYKWKYGDAMKFTRINGATLLTMPYQEAVWTSTDMSWEAFMDLIIEHGGATLTEVLNCRKTLPIEDSLSKDSHLTFGEGLDDFLKSTRV